MAKDDTSEVICEENKNKVYTIGTFPNSKNETFGITIRGKTKLYVDAHLTLKDFLSVENLSLQNREK